MSENSLSNSDATNRDAACVLGRVIFLIDESGAMEARIADGTKPKADAAATAINSLLKQLAAVAGLEVALVGFRAGSSGEADIGCRWDAPLAGRTFVGSEELLAAPAAIETRTRKVPPPGGVGLPREEKIEFPVWYVPRLGLMASRGAAMEYCLRLLADRSAAGGSCDKPPLIISFVGDLAAISGLGMIAETLLRAAPSPAPLLFHAHLSSSSRIPPMVYPSVQAHLPPGPVQEIFEASSILPIPFVLALREAQTIVNPGARGMIVHAKLLDLIRLLSLVKAYAAWQMPPVAVPMEPAPIEPATALPVAVELPPVEPAQAVPSSRVPESVAMETPTPIRAAGPALVVLLLDRSSAEPTVEKNVFTRLAANANDVLGQIAKRGAGKLAAAVVAYGADASGQEEPLLGFSGALTGQKIVPDDELTAGALRVEESVEKVSNGIGGIAELTRKRPIWIEMPAAFPAECAAAAEEVAAIASEWHATHPGAQVVVVHLTRGLVDPQPLRVLPGDILVYHYLTTELPQRSVAYPDHAGQIDQPGAARLWHFSTRLFGVERLAGKRPGLTAESRGYVVNGKFDLLLDGLLEAASTT